MEDIIQEIRSEGARITAIGVGGGGSNMISYLTNTKPHKAIKLVAANTDIQHLESAGAGIRVKLGEKLTRGLGAGMKPDIGERAALETYEELKATLQGSDIVFVSAGLGGGTGTGAAPVVAKAAREMGALTISVVTKPFGFEGRKRMRLAEEGLQNLKAESDCIVVIPNERLLSIIPKNCGIHESFEIVNDVLARAVNGIANIILRHGPNDINVDFADARTVMSHRGLALMGIGEASGDNAACDAMRQAIESPLLDNLSIKGAMGVLVNFEVHKDFPLNEMNEAMMMIEAIVDEDADVIFGKHTLDEIPQDFVRITVIATGFEKEILSQGSNESTPQSIQQEKSMEHSRQSIQIVRQQVSGDTYGNLFENGMEDVPTFLRNAKD